LEWVITGLFLFWILLEIMLNGAHHWLRKGEAPVAVVREVISLVTFPMIIAVWVIGLNQWGDLQVQGSSSCAIVH